MCEKFRRDPAACSTFSLFNLQVLSVKSSGMTPIVGTMGAGQVSKNNQVKLARAPFSVYQRDWLSRTKVLEYRMN
jgi:hypothetical protein